MTTSTQQLPALQPFGSEQFTRAVQITVCTYCAQVLANGAEGWGLDAAGRELGEVHAARMRDTDASVQCLEGIEGPDRGVWRAATGCELCGDDRFGRRVQAVEFWVRPEAVEAFLAAYVQCALWASTDCDGDPLAVRHRPGDLSAATYLQMRADCWDFLHANLRRLDAYVRAGGSIADAGHDFWLTRNRHGAGFWDRGIGELGERLTEAAHPYGPVDLYVGDDGAVHVR